MRIGSTEISKIMFGSNQVTKVMLGSTQISITNLIKLQSLLANGNFSNGMTGWTPYYATAAVNSGVCSIIVKGSDSMLFGCINYVGSYPNTTDKVYYRCKVMVTNSDCIKIVIRSSGAETAAIINNPIIDTWYTISCVKAVGSTSANFSPSHYYTTAQISDGKVCQVKECGIINLTAQFGAGNEPTKEWCDTNIAITY